jgi:hypothetical protein
MTNSKAGITWQLILVCASLIASVFYVVETYTDTNWTVVQWLHNADTVFTALFTFDFALGMASSSNVLEFLIRISTVIDLATFVPYYIQMAVQDLKVKLAIFRFLKIYRLLRIMRLFKSTRSLSGPTRQMIILLITLFCVVLISGGIFQVQRPPSSPLPPF